MVLNKGSSSVYSIKDHYEILVRLALDQFAKNPEAYRIQAMAVEASSKPGFMCIVDESLMSKEICQVIMRNALVRRYNIFTFVF